MKPRLMSRIAAGAHDARTDAEPAKRVFGTAPSYGDASTGDEERGIRYRVIPLARSRIWNQQTSQIGSNGHQSRLIEFALTNMEDGGGEINICQRQAERLADAKSGTI
jgi:hypothetical protein